VVLGGADHDERSVCSSISSHDGRVTEGGGAETLQRLAHTYLGPDVVFPNMPDPPPGFVTRITPERIRGLGPWNRSRG
jgi:hypothetical protein